MCGIEIRVVGFVHVTALNEAGSTVLRRSLTLFPPPLAGWATYLLLHGARLLLLQLCANPVRSPASPVPPPPAANHLVKDTGQEFSLHS